MMRPRAQRRLRIAFLIFGWLTGVLFVVSEAGALVVYRTQQSPGMYRPPGGVSAVVWGALIYLGMSLVGFFAAWRLRTRTDGR